MVNPEIKHEQEHPMKKLSGILTAAFAAILLSALPAPVYGGTSAHSMGGAHAGGQLPPGHVPTDSGKHLVAPKEGEKLLAGEVVEKLDSGGYTYVRIKNDKGESWVAIPTADVEIGEHMVFAPGDTMYDFESKTLKRKFDSIVFSPGPMYLPGTQMERKSRDAKTDSKMEEVKQAEGKDSYKVSSVFLKRVLLNNKTISVRGKVVKVSKNIMGKNWIHLQDGSGTPEERNHDLVVTTDDLPSVGDIVTVTGKVAADKDFGYGYKYDVIIEDATVAKK